MQNYLKLKSTLILSIFIHTGVVLLLYKVANHISFLGPISITSFDLAVQDVKPQQASAPKQIEVKNTETVLKKNSELNKSYENQIGTASELGSDEVSNQSQISSPAKLISVVRAQRTPEAKKANYVADAKVLIIVNQQGVVDSAKLLNNLEYGLNEVALDIARKLKFRPARIGKNAVRTQIELTINFKSSN